MLGHMLIRVLSTNHEVFGSTLGRYSSESPIAQLLDDNHLISGVDGCNWLSVENAIKRIKPDVIINCIGLIKQKLDSNRTIEAICLNSLLPHQLARICDKSGLRLIHISTDCVFQGSPGLKRLSDSPDATDLYGVSKRLGEIDYGNALTLRTGFIGRQLSGSESLVEWLISQRGQTIKGFVNAIYSGLTTSALSRVIQDVIEGHQSLTGVYQVASVPISKFDLLTQTACYLDLGITVIPDNQFSCDRSLDASSFLEATNIGIPSWDEMLHELSSDSRFYNFRQSQIG